MIRGLRGTETRSGGGAGMGKGLTGVPLGKGFKWLLAKDIFIYP